MRMNKQIYMKKIILIFAALVLFCTGADAQKSRNHVIGFYNLENLFDVYNDPVKNDEEFLPEGKNKWTEAKYQLSFLHFPMLMVSNSLRLSVGRLMAVFSRDWS